MRLPLGLKVVAWGQVWGAATGTWAVVQAVTSAGEGRFTWTFAAVVVALTAFYTTSGVAALFVLRQRAWAIDLLAAMQLPLLVQVRTGSFAVSILSGVFWVLEFRTNGFGTYAGALSRFTLSWGALEPPYGIMLNLVAAGTLWYLVVVHPRQAERARKEAPPGQPGGNRSTAAPDGRAA